MGGFEGLLAVLAVLYLIECVHVIPSTAEVLSMRGKSSDGSRPEGEGFGLGNWRLILSDPLPPLCGWFILTPWTFIVAPAGIAGHDAETVSDDAAASAGEAPGFPDIAADGCRVTLAGRTIWTGVSDRAARHLATWLRELAGSPPEVRANRIRAALREKLNLVTARQRLESARRMARPLQWLCHLLLVHFFLVLPFLAISGLILVAWIPYLMGMVALLSAILFLMRRLHRRIHDGNPTPPDLPILKLALAPPGAIRAYDLLLSQLLIDLDPLAAARLTLNPASFERIARRRAWDLGLLQTETPTVEPHDVSQWFRQEQAVAVREFLASQNLPVHRLLEPPSTGGNLASSYCPRCHEVFTRDGGTCTDCLEVPLRKRAGALNG